MKFKLNLTSIITKRLYNQTKSYSSKSITKSDNYILNLYKRQPLVIVSGEGCVVKDEKSESYLDFTSSIAVNSLGHNPSGLAEIIFDQSKKLITTSNLFYNQESGELAEKLVKTTDLDSDDNPYLNKVFFSSSGTEANEAALKLARKYHYELNDEKNKYGIVAIKGGFHGRSLGSLSVTFNHKYQTPFQPLLPGVNFLNRTDTWMQIEKGINDKTAAVILEPLQGEGGVFPLDIKFISAINRRCKEVGALLIFDEIQCGLGRSGKVWYHHHLLQQDPTLIPDILTVAKPLGNGYPIAATLVNDKIAATIKQGDHGTTFGGNPLASRIGNYAIDKLTDPKLLDHVNGIGNYLLSQLQSIDSSHIQNVRGKGLLIGVQLSATVKAQELVDYAFQNKILLLTAGDNTLRLAPPLIVSKEQVDQVIQIIQDFLSKV